MGKPKKGKKGKADDDFEDDVDFDVLARENSDEIDDVMSNANMPISKKKTKKKKGESLGEDDLAVDMADLSMEDSDIGDVNGDVDNMKPSVKQKKKDKKKNKKRYESDEDEDLIEAVSVRSKNKKKSAGMSGFSALIMDDEDSIEEISEEEEPIKADQKVVKQQSTEDEKEAEMQDKPAQQQVSKKKKKEKKKKKDDEEDIDALLAEIEGKTAPDKGIEFKDISSMTQEEIAAAMEAQYDEEDDKKRKKKKKDKKEDKKSEDQQETEDALEGEEEEEDNDGTVKTAAQKKKEKKERQKLKKLEEKAKEKKKKGKEGSKEPAAVGDGAVAEEDKEAAAEENGAQVNEDEVEDKKKSKKDRKKKKGEKEEEKETKKKPNKMAKLILEQQKKFQEEEERIRKEMEEKEKKIEEARRQKELEAQRLKEKKEKEKQKKKEKIEKQKKEGTYLTAKQKEQRRQALARLEAMKAQGYEIGTNEEVQKKKRPVYDNRKKTKKQLSQEEKTEDKDSTPEVESNQLVDESITQTEKEDKKPAEEIKDSWEDEEEVKDSWDLSDDEEETKKSNTTETKLEDKTTDKKSRVSESSSTKSEAEEEESSTEEETSEDDSSEEDSDEESSSDEDEHGSLAAKQRAKALARIQKRKLDAEKKKNVDVLRAPVVVVLGHVDTGKTKILDKLRRTNVQDNEAGGITQQIGATNVPAEAIKDATKMCKEFSKNELKLPGLLIIDTPGHESFSNLRSRGSSLCDIAILVVDIMHGLEPQTIESIGLLKERKTPFVVALNKIDRLYQWQSNPHSDVVNVIKKQKPNTKIEFEERAQQVIVQLAEQSLNAKLFYENKNPKEYISLVPTSAHTGDGMGNLIALICELTQSHLAKRLAFSEELHATVMEVKALPGLGTTIDVILVNGKVNEGDTIIVPGSEGPIVTQIRGLLMPQPMRELRVKNAYEHHKTVNAAQGVKIIAKDLDKALAGLPLYIAHFADEIDIYKEELSQALHEVLSSIKLAEKGVFVQASTLGSLEALLQFLKDSKIPYAGINIGPVHKKDVMKLSVMLDRDPQYGVLLAFDVKVERDAQEMADSLGLRIFTAEIIYHLFDSFMQYRADYKKSKQDEFKHIAVFPCKLRILPEHVYNSRDPIVAGVSVEAGFVKIGTMLCVPSQEFLQVGVVTSIEINHKNVDKATKGQEVCIKIDNTPGETPKLYGRHFDYNDLLVSKISRESIDAVKNYFRDEMSKTDWQLIVELKKLFQIL